MFTVLRVYNLRLLIGVGAPLFNASFLLLLPTLSRFMVSFYMLLDVLRVFYLNFFRGTLNLDTCFIVPGELSIVLFSKVADIELVFLICISVAVLLMSLMFLDVFF